MTGLTAEDTVRQAEAVHRRAEDLIRAGNPVAVELNETAWQAGFRAGIAEGERRAAARAAQWTTRFLHELGVLPDIPALESTHDLNWRAAA
ncbi:DUF2799 domain-containing protein [Kocuria marina]|uniref:DUF2799 domain-containing protein n=1 Tax=Kocuria marina TaxID=223184 RepID=UPI00117AC7A0